MYGSHKIPQQRLPLSKKTKKWKEECVDAFINLSKFGLSERRNYLKSLYDYYNGQIDDQDYKYVLKPYGKSRENFPSKLRNYPIIKPIIDLLLGEKAKRPLNFSVAVKNSDVVSQKQKVKQELLFTTVQQMFLQELSRIPGFEQPEQGSPPIPKEIMEEFENTYTDNRAIKGQAAINYIMQNEEVYDKFQKMFFHFLVAGECYTEKGVSNSETFYDVLNPMDIDFDKDPDIDFVEDGDWAIVRKFSHASTIIDRFGDQLTDEQILELENPQQTSVESYLLYRAEASGADDNIYRNRLIECVTVYWKSRKRIGFVTYIDPTTGAVEEFQVDEGYKMPITLKEQGGKVNYEWVNEVWQGTKIDGRFFADISPVSNQRISIDNPSRCKLPVNGRKYSDINSSNISLVSLGIPYQLNYNIFKYRMELAIARSKDIIAQFDINMIPKKWDMDKFMYYIEGTGIAWVDYNKEGIMLSPQHQSVLDMSIKTIGQYISLLESIMMEWEKISGVNRQRQGTIGAYEGKGSSQQAIMQSSHITEDLFRKFAQLEQRELQGLLDYSKEAWVTGKKATYVMPDMSTETLEIDALDHMESEYGIFVSNAGDDQSRLKEAKQLSQAMIQNGMPPSQVLDLLDTNNLASIKSKMRKAEKAGQQLQKAQQEAAQQQDAMKMQMQQRSEQVALIEKEKDRQLEIEKALIVAESNDSTDKINLDLEKFMKEYELKNKELDLKEQALYREGDTEPNGK
tara:strand:- start:854 stop:3070 length:2217 start_codon:yes stop_codon:yes gene_type:complete